MTVEGAEHLDGGRAVSSSSRTTRATADGLALMALPCAVGRCVSSRRRSSGTTCYARWFLDGIGALYVDRFDVTRSVAHAGGARRGPSRRAEHPHLRGGNPAPHAGPAAHSRPAGFMAAVEAGRPRSCRSCSAGRGRLCGTKPGSRGGSQSTFGSALRYLPPATHSGADGGPAAEYGPDVDSRSDWSRAVELRDTVRAWMLAHCGEPDLANRNPLRDLIESRTSTGR